MPDPSSKEQAPRALETYLGPYEHWMFKTGKAYGYPGLLPDEKVATTLFAEWDSAVSTDNLSGKKIPFWPVPIPGPNPGPAPQPVHLYFPELWKPAGGFETRYLPFIHYDRDRSAGLLEVFETLVSTFDNFLAKNPLDFFTQTVTSATSNVEIRFNQPLCAETVDVCWEAPTDQLRPTHQKVVVLAIIDDGIPFAHRNFLDHNGHTRIDYCWSQSATGGGNKLLFGREFTGAQIDDMIRTARGNEDAIYRQSGLAYNPNPRLRFPLDRMHSHGAHVLDTMAGSWPADKDTQVRIIAVDLPAMSSWDTSGFGKDMAILSAMHYVFDRADRIGAAYGQTAVPLVLNMSYGHSGGAHDGSNLIESAFDELIQKRRDLHHPTALVMPSGNIFLDRVHSVLNKHHFDQAGTDEIDQTWFLPPDDRTSSFVELWLPLDMALDELALKLFAPNGGNVAIAERKSESNHQDITLDGRVIGQLTGEKFRGDRNRIVIALAPTLTAGAERFDPDAKQHPPTAAPAGEWRIRIKVLDFTKMDEVSTTRGGGTVAGGLQCWIQRDVDYRQAESGARQSYFIDPYDLLFDDDGAPRMRDPIHRNTRTRRFGTLNGMATAATALVVGGSLDSACEAAFYSSAGALRHNSRPPHDVVQIGKKVDLSAASERSPFHRGIIAAGSRSGITVSLRGTSSAAPQTARRLAEKFLDTNVTPDAPDNYLSLLSNVPTECTVQGNGPLPDQLWRLGSYVLPLQRENPNKD